MSSPAKRTVALTTLGCRLNQYETEKMAAELYRFGFERVDYTEPADLYIINTCTVTHRADSDSRQAISRAARENPNSRIVVAGCYVDNDPERIAGMEGVDVIIRNSEKVDIAAILPRHLPDLFDHEPEKGCSAAISDFYGHNRAWLKVGDGCNQWCTFCILPTVRGRLRNRPAAEIIAEVKSLVANGFEEVVLTGIHLAHYKNQKVEPYAKNLAALCRLILEQTEVKRIRLSSIEPQSVRDDLLEVYTNSNGRICRHWHVPLQSGSSRILRLMQRPYDQNTYLRRVTAIKEAVPNTIIGADVIVGFPGESDDDFEKTRKVAESGLIDYLHVFSYSNRPGTPAATLPDKVPTDVVKERNAILTRLSHRLRIAAHERQVGETLGVIAEHKQIGDEYFWGVADNYIKVKLPGHLSGGKEIVTMRITESHGEYVAGEEVGAVKG
jgi:threonylcarbamoyladenosine tRNA methylthiotransferase MtaB